MKTELLIIKNNSEYIRFIDGSYKICGLDKASVFPVEQLFKVKEYITKLKMIGFEDACIKKLIITEEDFQ
ncbi:MAG: hypothetical protein JW864_03500 [Spirochaetes bacterium]|nr:hypothetical protein [Spirochaetota bacterium]